MDTPDRAPVSWPPAVDEHAALIERCHSMGWTDGLPVLPPTTARVDAMLGKWIDRRHEVIATLPPVQGEATLETIAANCVLAGCLPDHLPVVAAAVQAVAQRRFNLDAAVTGVNSVSPGGDRGRPDSRKTQLQQCSGRHRCGQSSRRQCRSGGAAVHPQHWRGGVPRARRRHPWTSRQVLLPHRRLADVALETPSQPPRVRRRGLDRHGPLR